MPSKPKNSKKKVVFLFSDTGGGHRSAAEAVIEALNREFPGRYTCEMVDFFEDYSPPPFNLAGPVYPVMSRMEYLWKRGFEVSNNPDRIRVIYSMLWPYIRHDMYKLVEEHPCDLYVSVHPIINIPLLRAIRKRGVRSPFLIIVTDLVSTHSAWYAKEADLVIIPTNKAVRQAIRANVNPEKLKVVGLPVDERFRLAEKTREELRSKYGWPEDMPVILLVGGGEGMGPLEEIANAINNEKFDAGIAIVTGRNQRLKQNLDKTEWHIPSYIYGFRKDMPNLMRSADILITKAGPGTISEALISGLPIILYHRIPGQEEGNVSYVLDEGAGIWAPEIEDIIGTLKDWLDHPEKRYEAVRNANRIAKPNASIDIAHVISKYLERTH
jgi:1,2-diacylglycerol 3-beta-galactosyltransferase